MVINQHTSASRTHFSAHLMGISTFTQFCLLLILCAGLFSACSSPEKDKKMYYNNALEYIKKGDPKTAILELRNAIQLDAKFGEARYQLGLLYLKEGEPKKAFDELIRAAELLPDNLDASLKVAFFYLMSGKKEECRKRLDHILTKDPTYRDALALLAQLEFSEGHYDQALAALEKIGEELDKSAELQNLKGRILAAQKQWEGAEKAFQKAIAIDDAAFANYQTLVLFYETRGEKDKVQTLLTEIAKKFPNDAGAHLLQASYYGKAGEIEKVEAELEKVIALEPKDLRFRLQLADYLKQSGKNDQAEKVLIKARTDIPDNPDLTAALATYYFDRGKFDQAKSLLKEMEAKNSGHSGTQLLQARFLLKEGKAKESMVILQGLNKDFPNLPEPFFYLGLAHYRLGEIDFAQQAVATAIQKNGKNPQYHTFMAELYLAKGAFEDARNEAATALQLNKKNVAAALILGRALIGTKQYDQAVTILTDMNRQIAGNKDILGNLALASLGAKEPEKAVEFLTELLEIDPGNVQSVALLIGFRYKDDYVGAETFVRQQIAKAPKDSRLYILLGELLERQKKDEEALAAYDKAQELSPDNSQSLLAAAKLLTRLGKNKEAMAKYEAMVEKDPKSTGGLMGIAALYVAEGSNDKAIEQYKNILQINDKNILAANNLAWLIASKPDGDLGKALMLAMNAKRALPDDPSIADTLGWVHYQRGSYSLALSQFAFALQHKPDDPVFTYHLALAQKGDGKKEEATQTLGKLLERKVEFADRKKAEELYSELQKK
ncbi:tetratricopeptide repeat protein [Desulfopila sp. IMCC35006]|uniref:tetratricopeptide repeat protein n=1 Tax=Desulfopila sp. IMCC35006 TaxID=2569542 RepID=UPI0010ABED9E|nr:tetratricopeptide repeat protein [Desulfopila sp. IMCC35006]TKB23223.1 tetratricopeptide repeat protein [Desulfopila sp. IMCC35006]